MNSYRPHMRSAESGFNKIPHRKFSSVMMGRRGNFLLLATVVLLLLIISGSSVAQISNLQHGKLENQARASLHSRSSDDISAYTSEPAPMGISDHGLGPNGIPYRYFTSSFLGIAHIFSLTTKNSSGDNEMSIQMNTVLQVVYGSGQVGYFFVQLLDSITTGDNSSYVSNDVWNDSEKNASIGKFAVGGQGTINPGTPDNPGDYYAEANSITYSYPYELELEVNASSTDSGTPFVLFTYNDGNGWQTLDNLTFKTFSNVSPSNVRFVVDGSNYDPSGIFEDAEFVACGLENSWNTTDVGSNMTMQAEYWNGHNFQQINNAYNFGDDTAEGIDNATSSSYAFSSNGSLAALLTAGGLASLGKLYDQSQVSAISFTVPFPSGTLYVATGNRTTNSTGYPFVGQQVNITSSPGTYAFYLYSSDGTLEKTLSESLVAGKYLAVDPRSLSFSSTDNSTTTLANASTNATQNTLSSSTALTSIATIQVIFGLFPGNFPAILNDRFEYHSNDTPKLFQRFSGLLHLGFDFSTNHSRTCCVNCCRFVET